MVALQGGNLNSRDCFILQNYRCNDAIFETCLKRAFQDYSEAHPLCRVTDVHREPSIKRATVSQCVFAPLKFSLRSAFPYCNGTVVQFEFRKEGTRAD